MQNRQETLAELSCFVKRFLRAIDLVWIYHRSS